MPPSQMLPLAAILAIHLSAQAPVAPPSSPGTQRIALSGMATVGSQYIWRGLTQTDGKPTIQGEWDLVHPSGFYLSMSLSNISWYTDQNAGVASRPTALGSPGRVGPPTYDPDKVNSAGVELDLFGGYKWGFARDCALDVGIYRYFYPGNFENLGAYRNPSTTEAYVGLSRSWASLKYSRSISANYMGVAYSGGTTYLDLSLAIPVGESGWTVQLHGGNTTFAPHANVGYFFNGSRLAGDNALFSYSDLKLGVSREIKGYTLALAFTSANTRARADDHDITVYENAMGRNMGGARLTFTITKGF